MPKRKRSAQTESINDNGPLLGPLSVEIILHIMKFTDGPSVMSLSLSSKRLHQLLFREDLLWRRLINTEFDVTSQSLHYFLEKAGFSWPRVYRRILKSVESLRAGSQDPSQYRFTFEDIVWGHIQFPHGAIVAGVRTGRSDVKDCLEAWNYLTRKKVFSIDITEDLQEADFYFDPSTTPLLFNDRYVCAPCTSMGDDSDQIWVYDWHTRKLNARIDTTFDGSYPFLYGSELWCREEYGGCCGYTEEEKASIPCGTRIRAYSCETGKRLVKIDVKGLASSQNCFDPRTCISNTHLAYWNGSCVVVREKFATDGVAAMEFPLPGVKAAPCLSDNFIAVLTSEDCIFVWSVKSASFLCRIPALHPARYYVNESGLAIEFSDHLMWCCMSGPGSVRPGSARPGSARSYLSSTNPDGEVVFSPCHISRIPTGDASKLVTTSIDKNFAYVRDTDKVEVRDLRTTGLVATFKCRDLDIWCHADIDLPQIWMDGPYLVAIQSDLVVFDFSNESQRLRVRKADGRHNGFYI